MTHANLSPSKRVRWAACPGSVREEARYPDTSGPAAIDGTHSHTLLSTCLTAGKPSSFYVGITLSDDFGEFKVDDDRAERVRFALGYVAALKKELNATVRAEQRVDPAKFFGRDDLSGTVDIQIIGDDVLEIIDYKDGVGVVEAKDNPQLELYAFGALANYSTDRFKTIRMTIIQPKLRSKGLSGIVTHEQSVESLLAKADGIRLEAAATDDPNAPLVPGEAQCHFCKHRGACGALASQVLATAGISFGNMTISEPTTLSDNKIRELIEAAPLIRQMLDAVEAEALRRMEAGQEIEGLKVVRGRGARSWSAEDDVIAAVLKKMGVPRGTLWKTSLISIAQIEKAKWTKRDGSEKSLSERQLNTMTEYVKKSDGRLQCVGTSDPRPAVTVSAAQLFAPVEKPSWMC